MEYSESCREAKQRAGELCSLRKSLISEALRRVFPIEVESLSQQDAGEEGKCGCLSLTVVMSTSVPADYPGQQLIDCDSVTEVEGGWVLGGVHKVPTPHICIVTAPLRADGDHSLYLAAG